MYRRESFEHRIFFLFLKTKIHLYSCRGLLLDSWWRCCALDDNSNSKKEKRERAFGMDAATDAEIARILVRILEFLYCIWVVGMNQMHCIVHPDFCCLYNSECDLSGLFTCCIGAGGRANVWIRLSLHAR